MTRAARVFSASAACALSLAAHDARAADWFTAQLDISDAYVTGRYDPVRYGRFTKATPAGGMLHKTALGAFAQMRMAAAKVGIKLRVISATRNFDAQKRIWELKWTNLASTVRDERQRALNILQFSSMPGTSRHHWGTDVDLGHGRCGDAACLEAPAWNGKEYQWLVNNAFKYGYCQPYYAGRAGLGYREERWHWSFHPLARLVQQAYEHRLDKLAPQPGSFVGAGVGSQLYKDFVKNAGCSSETRSMVREAMTAIGIPLSAQIKK